ncbi:MAG: hypothetical protein AAFO61_14900, partial [Pseudomonadota bacterium]
FVEIYNLKEAHRNAVAKELETIQIEAGYMPPDGGSSVGLIAVAEIRDVTHDIEKPDIITRIEFGEGDKSAAKATTSKTFPKGTPVTDIVEQLYKDMEKQGVKRGEWKFPDKLKDEVRKRPVTIHGDTRAELDMLGRSHGFYHSVQNNALEILPSNGFLDGAVVLSSGSGLIDVPSITDNGVTVNAMMNPQIRPGRRVRVISKKLEMNSEGDLYRVSSATYFGDNKDGEFRVAITGEAMKGGKVDEGVRAK